MPANLYQSDKILRALKMPYEKIHACEKGCALFRLEYADLNYCPICKSSRYIVVDNGMGEKTQTKILLMFFGICQLYQDFNVFSWSKRWLDRCHGTKQAKEPN